MGACWQADARPPSPTSHHKAESDDPTPSCTPRFLVLQDPFFRTNMYSNFGDLGMAVKGLVDAAST